MDNQTPTPSPEELEKKVAELEAQLARARGALAMQKPDYAVKRLQELGLQPQMAEMVDVRMRKGPLNRVQLVEVMGLPKDHPWITNIDGFWAMLSKTRKRLETNFNATIETTDPSYYFGEENMRKIDNAMKGIVPEPPEKKEE